MIKAILLSLILFWCLYGVNAQALLFGEDTVFLYSCDPRPDLIGITQMYNTTGDEIYVQWQTEYYDLPHNGVYVVILAGHQYLPFDNGDQFIFDEDSSEILFYMWNDTLLPGDTSLVQIRIWDDMDSVNTSALITALQVCPLATVVRPAASQAVFKVFPNPARDVVFIHFNEDRVSSVRVLNMLGIQMMEIPCNERTAQFDTTLFPTGVYYITALQDGQPIGQQSVLIQK